MGAYGTGFAAVYNRQWAGFAKKVAPPILDLYSTTPIADKNRLVLDLCCGTGQFAVEALGRGYAVVGIDGSSDMLHHAKENARSYMETGMARFIQGDARSFELEQKAGLAVSTYDSLNHLDTEADLAQCFRAVFGAVAPGGSFIFDLNTRAKLRKWPEIEITDTDELLLIQRVLFVEEKNKAYIKITGLTPSGTGLYERFDETLSNTAFALDTVQRLLLEVGWHSAHCARLDELTVPLADPESESRVFFVAAKDQST